MEYRRLGSTGLKVSALSYGAWVTFGRQVGRSQARELIALAYDRGINFFDNAETYNAGEAERLMGDVIADLRLPRDAYCVSSKVYFGAVENPRSTQRGLSRKHVFDACHQALERLRVDYLDMYFCHRPDPATPVEETVWAMSDMITRGKALYWGTSEWSADEIRAAYEIAERHHLHKPVVEQPQYNLFHRTRVEQEYARLYDDYGMGLTTWSPLASGLLTGKYRNGVPPDSRAQLHGYDWLRDRLTDPASNDVVERLGQIAAELGCSTGQLAIAWVLANPRVSSVITGASRLEQIGDNMRALDVVAKLTPEVRQRIEAVVGDAYE